MRALSVYLSLSLSATLSFAPKHFLSQSNHDHPRLTPPRSLFSLSNTQEHALRITHHSLNTPDFNERESHHCFPPHRCSKQPLACACERVSVAVIAEKKCALSICITHTHILDARSNLGLVAGFSESVHAGVGILLHHDAETRAVCCSVLQCAAGCCIVLQCVAGCCRVLHCALCCTTLQCVALCCTAITMLKPGRCVAVCCSVLQGVALCCSALQCVAGCCRVLHCCTLLYYVAVRCIVLHRVAVSDILCVTPLVRVST